MEQQKAEVRTFVSEGKLAPEGVEFNNRTADELRGNTAIEIYDRDTRRCQCSGVVTEAYDYGGMKILAVWDADEPLAWAMILNPDGTVTHYDTVYDLLAIPGWAETLDEVESPTEEECALTGARYAVTRESLEKLRGRSVPEPERQIVKLIFGALTKESRSIEDRALRALVDVAAANGEFDKSPWVDPWRACCAHIKHLMELGALEEVEEGVEPMDKNEYQPDEHGQHETGPMKK